MQAYVHALMAWGLFNYVLNKDDIFITVVCSAIFINLHCPNVINSFGKFHLCLFLYQTRQVTRATHHI